jgi:uncharacterized membrane protein YphA (DoxX/SURF4 family)
LHLSNAALALFLLFWIVALHGPLVTAAPGDVRRWLYLGEVLAIACGALMLWATPGHGRAAMAARLGFALSLLTFGASHFAYLKVTAAVVPAYIPAPMAVARITGAAHVAAGLALLSNLLPRLAAALEAAMMSVFVLLVNAPDVLSSPTNRGAWTALLAEGALVGAAWIVAAALREPAAGANKMSLDRIRASGNRTPLAKGRELVRLGQSDPCLDQVKEDAQTDERRQADDLLTRTQSDQGQHATDADDGRSSEEAEVQRRAGQRYASASKHPRRCATGDVQCGDGQC